MKNQEIFFTIPYNSIAEIPMDEYKHLHKAYWEFIAENRMFSKPPIRFKNGEQARINSCCFACEYAMKHAISCLGDSQCDFCPFSWGEGNMCCSTGTVYNTWNETRKAILYSLCDVPNNLEETALEIANLEWEDSHHDN